MSKGKWTGPSFLFCWQSSQRKILSPNWIVIQFSFLNAPLAELYDSWEISIRDSNQEILNSTIVYDYLKGEATFGTGISKDGIYYLVVKSIYWRYDFYYITGSIYCCCYIWFDDIQKRVRFLIESLIYYHGSASADRLVNTIWAKAVMNGRNLSGLHKSQLFYLNI